jgi:nitrogen fixation protein NifZ
VRPRFDYGDEVRLVRTVRNDGTFSGLETGALLVRAGRVAVVRNVGTFLQEAALDPVERLEEAADAAPVDS